MKIQIEEDKIKIVLAKTKLLTMIAKRQIHPTTGHEGRE
jgi:hypothetical protein